MSQTSKTDDPDLHLGTAAVGDEGLCARLVTDAWLLGQDTNVVKGHSTAHHGRSILWSNTIWDLENEMARDTRVVGVSSIRLGSVRVLGVVCLDRSFCAVVLVARGALFAIGAEAGGTLCAHTDNVSHLDVSLNVLADTHSTADNLMAYDARVIGRKPSRAKGVKVRLWKNERMQPERL